MPKNKLHQLNLNQFQFEKFEKYIDLFLETNSKLNLISKNDENFLFEKHIFDSLAINKFLEPQKEQTLLDIGTGGGFPSIPIAIFYPELKIYAADSIRKKINAIEYFKQELNLQNLIPICDRVENLNMKFDYVTSRAVASLDKILEYGIPKLKKGGFFIAYKSKKYEEEIQNAKTIINKFKLEKPKIIKYNLPLNETFERNLIIFKN